MKTAYIFLLALALPMLTFAQGQSWQGGVFMGISNYSGDINPSDTPDFSDSGIALGVTGRTPIAPHLGFRGSLLYSKLNGDDANYEERANRGFKFSTSMVELTLIAEWEPFGKDRFYQDAAGETIMDRLISPYLFGGVGLGFASLDTDFSGYEGNRASILAGIQQDRNEGSSKTSVIVPLGIGVKFDLSESFTLAAESGMRLTFSDYLDGISKAASDDNDDIYFSSGLILYYRFDQ